VGGRSIDILFVQSGHHRIATVATRQDKVRVSIPVYGPLDPIPHDLAHYVIEQELGLHDGFWGSVAAGALFGGMKILAGRQRPHAAQRSRDVLAAHRQGIGVSELLVDAGLRAVKGMNLDDAPLPIDSPLVRTRADLIKLVAQLHPALDRMCERWSTIALGETLHVVWSDHDSSAHQRTHRHAFH
jgi:hypothetical protein